jgi:hypothetical protein
MMSSFNLGMAIEVVVAFLLVLTIFYCVVLNKRLTRLRADEEILRATISELITATEIAERAIMGLKAAAADCETTLGGRMKAAEALIGDLDRRLDGGSDIVKRLGAIIGAAMPGASPAHAVPVEPVRESPSRALQVAADAAAERMKAYRRGRREEAA